MGQYTTHETLLQRLSEGSDAESWREFYERYGGVIRGFARRRGLQPADCDEILQDVLTSLTQAMPGFRYDPSKGKFRSYLKTIALRAVFRRGRQKPAGTPLDELGGDDAAPAREDEADALWEEEWRQYHLRQALRTVRVEFSESDRVAFEEYALKGRDAQETAAELDLSIDQVYQAKSRILKRLSALIARQVEEEG